MGGGGEGVTARRKEKRRRERHNNEIRSKARRRTGGVFDAIVLSQIARSPPLCDLDFDNLSVFFAI